MFIAIIAIALIAILFLYRIGTLTPQATTEASNRINAASVKKIINNPINAPYKIARHAAYKLNPTLASERSIGALVAITSVGIFYMVIKRFMSKYAAILSTILYASSSTLLNNARIASPDIMLLMLFVLFACGYIILASRHNPRSWIVGTIATCVALYTPGMLYFILIGAVIIVRYLLASRSLPKKQIIGLCCAITTILLLPLVYAFVSNPLLYKEYLALPSTMPTIISFLKSTSAVPLGILVKAPINPMYRLGEQPMLDVTSTLLFTLGCVSLAKHYRLKRVYIIFGIFVLGTTITAMSNNYENSFMLFAFVYFTAGFGIDYLLRSWKQVFPHNPFAVYLSLAVISVAVLVSVNFQIKRYYVAWPHNPAVQAAFSKK